MLSQMKISFLLFVLAVLAGCSSNVIKEDYSFSESIQKGVLLGSITYEGSYSEYGVHYRKVSEQKKDGYVSIGESVSLIPLHLFSSMEIEQGDIEGEVFGLSLEPGLYEFYAWKVSSAGIKTKSTEPFSLRFEVKPGKSIYIGNFNFTQTDSRGLTVTGASVDFSNQVKRDMNIIGDKYINLSDIGYVRDKFSVNVGENKLSTSEFYWSIFSENINRRSYTSN